MALSFVKEIARIDTMNRLADGQHVADRAAGRAI
jgi:hypothetical protein